MSKHTPGPWAVNRYITSGNQSLGFHITGPRDGGLSPVCVGEPIHDSRVPERGNRHDKAEGNS